jgi:hypothetical protein
MMAEKVYHPIVESKGAVHLWSETITKEVRENFESFFANIQITQGYKTGSTFTPKLSQLNPDFYPIQAYARSHMSPASQLRLRYQSQWDRTRWRKLTSEYTFIRKRHNQLDETDQKRPQART